MNYRLNHHTRYKTVKSNYQRDFEEVQVMKDVIEKVSQEVKIPIVNLQFRFPYVTLIYIYAYIVGIFERYDPLSLDMSTMFTVRGKYYYTKGVMSCRHIIKGRSNMQALYKKGHLFLSFMFEN